MARGAPAGAGSSPAPSSPNQKNAAAAGGAVPGAGVPTGTVRTSRCGPARCGSGRCRPGAGPRRGAAAQRRPDARPRPPGPRAGGVPRRAGEGRGRRRGLFGRRSRSEEAFWDGEPDARGDDPDPPRGRGRAGRAAGPTMRDRATGIGPPGRASPRTAGGPGAVPPGRLGQRTRSRLFRRGAAVARTVRRRCRAIPGPARQRGLSRRTTAAAGRAGSGRGSHRSAHRTAGRPRPARGAGWSGTDGPAGQLGGGGPRDDPGDSNQRLRGRRHRALADPAPDGAVPERAAAPWAGEPVGSRRRPAAPGAAAPAHGGPRLRYRTTVQMQPGPGTSPGTGPLGSIRTYQPGTGPQVAVDDSASFWAGTGPGHRNRPAPGFRGPAHGGAGY